MKKISWLLWLLLTSVACQNGPDTLAEYEKAGREAYLEEDYAVARDYLSKAVMLKSSDRDVLYFMGMSYQREYILDSALFYLKRADLLHPEDREINQAIYPIAAELKEWETAARAVNVLIGTGDSLEHYRLKLADLNVKMGNFIVAYIHMRKLLESSPDDPDRYYQMAVIAHQIDSLDVALAVINQAIDRFGEQERFLQTKGVLYTALGEYDKAEWIIRRLLASDPNSLTYKVTLANALVMQKSRDKKLEARELYKQVQGKVSPALKVDSILTSLQQELN